MRSPAALWRFVRARLDRRALDREMDEEIALHLALHAEALERSGVPAAEAWRRGVAGFGGDQRYREEGRDARASLLYGIAPADPLLLGGAAAALVAVAAAASAAPAWRAARVDPVIALRAD